MPVGHTPGDYENRLLELSLEQRNKLVVVGPGQYPFQWNYSTGKILNLACGADTAGLWTRGAVNMDLHLIEMNLGYRQPLDVVGDVRHVPFKSESFDTVILGEILEHFNSEDVPSVLMEAARCLRKNGRIVATIPEDDREKTTEAMYADGVSVQHHLVRPGMICDWCHKADLELQVLNRLDYGWFRGYGMVATRVKDEAPAMPVLQTEVSYRA